MAKLDLARIRRVRVNDGDIENLADEIDCLRGLCQSLFVRPPHSYNDNPSCPYCGERAVLWNEDDIGKHDPRCPVRQIAEHLHS